MPAGLWVVLCAFKAAPGGGAWLQGRHFTAFGGRGGVLRVDGKKPRGWRWRGFGYLVDGRTESLNIDGLQA